jgi:hypothetical protein
LDNDSNRTDEGNNYIGAEGEIEEYNTTGETVQDDDEDYGYGDPLDEDTDDDAVGFEGEPDGSVERDEMGDTVDANDDDFGFGDL